MIAYYKFVFNRNNRPLSSGQKALVQLRMTTDRQARYFSTGIRIEKYQWAGKDGEWIVNHDAASEYNAFLWEILSRVQKANALAEIDACSLSYEAVKQLVRNEFNSDSFYDFAKKEISERKDLEESTRKKAYSFLNRLPEVGLLLFSDLTYENIIRVNNTLLEKNKPATVDKFHATLITYINRSIRLGLFPMDKNPYLRFKRQRPKETNRKYLSAEELARLESKSMPIARLDFVRDMFVFCCYTGLSYSDLANLTPQNIESKGGKQFVKIERQKTKEASSILLLSRPRIIMEKYSGRRTGFCFPLMSNQKLNAFLKEIAVLCGIDRHLTMHVARHTFATTVMLGNGVSLEVTQKALGHGSIRTTQIYAKLLDNRIASEMESIEDKLTGDFRRTVKQ